MSRNEPGREEGQDILDRENYFLGQKVLQETEHLGNDGKVLVARIYGKVV